MESKLKEALDDIVKEFTSSAEFNEYIELGKKIENEYQREVLMFNTAKEKLLEVKAYTKDLTIYEKALADAKFKLYSIPDVKRYKELENKLQKELDIMSNDIAAHLSNKFKKKRVI